jgi:hypothetical protein
MRAVIYLEEDEVKKLVPDLREKLDEAEWNQRLTFKHDKDVDGEYLRIVQFRSTKIKIK